MSEMFKLKINDLMKGAITAAITAVVAMVYVIFQTPDFNLFSADWMSIGKEVFNAAFLAFVGYLGKNLITDSEGKVGGVIQT